MKPSTKLLVAIDFTESPEEILSRVLALHPQTDDVEIILLHVIPEVQSPSFYVDSIHPAIDMHEIGVEAARRGMTRYLDTLVAHYPKITPVVREGVAFKKIVELANEHDVSYIIVGDHCRSGVSHFFHPNVAEQVIRNAKRNVLSFYVPS